MSLLLRSFAALIIAFSTSIAVAQNRPIISVSATPNRSRNGENIQFKISVTSKSSGRLAPPSIEGLADWEVVNFFRSESPRVTYVNGQVQYQYKAEYSYFLRPLKTGILKIPPINLTVGQETFKTDPLQVQVDALPNGAQTQARRNYNPPTQNNSRSSPRLPPLGQSGGQSGNNNLNNNANPLAANSKDSFFIRPEASKTEVYVGEAIELGYVLYERTFVRNFEMSKFPDFKGFIKEDLFIPKSFTRQRVQVGNEILNRSEFIRYALFPLKPGDIKISPFETRAIVMMRPEDLIDSLITGRQPPQLGSEIPMTKSSEPITITVKELPPPPPETQFTGAVGDFNIELKGPEGLQQVDQPFTVQFTIAGKGNIKLIEPPTLPLPNGLELYQTKNTAELREDITGYKNFEFLILPRAKGPIEIPSFQWAYFDPDKAQYETRTTPTLSFNVEGGTSSEAKDTPSKETVQVLSSFELEESELGPAPTYNFFGLNYAWPFLGAFYALLGVMYWNRSKEDQRRSHLRNNPWVKTEEKISDKEYNGSEGLAILVDQWIREFLAGHLREDSMHSESTRSDFERAIRSKLKVEEIGLIDKLQELFRDLDLVRFSGNKKNTQKINSKDFYKRAKTICDRIIQHCEFEIIDEEEDDDDF